MESQHSKIACKYSDAKRYVKEQEDFRNPFFRDIDRILYAPSYLRYSDKTQVFTFEEHAHVIKRAVHVQYVSKIARTIGRELGLNEDLIEAGALAHDLGHTPFGHEGENILNKISLENGCGYFKHNVHSIRIVRDIENYGKGLNLTYQVLDAVLCHNGEIYSKEYRPVEKSMEVLLEEYNKSYNEDVKLIPCTLEGCIVRISDIISYIGKDIEDAIRLEVIKKEDIPVSITAILGDTNREIINTIINDIINNSREKNYIKLSDEVFDALIALKKFNYKNIYELSYSSLNKESLEDDFRNLFNKYIEDQITNNIESDIISSYLNNMSEEYRKNSKERIAIDYIAGMTDSYFVKESKKINNR
ncbi:MAG: HD domain-containing protein [bacterium]